MNNTIITLFFLVVISCYVHQEIAASCADAVCKQDKTRIVYDKIIYKHLKKATVTPREGLEALNQRYPDDKARLDLVDLNHFSKLTFFCSNDVPEDLKKYL